MESVAKKLLLLIALVASGLSRLAAVFLCFSAKRANYLPASDESNHEKVYIILVDWEIHASTL